MCVCVCVCERERERERESDIFFARLLLVHSSLCINVSRQDVPAPVCLSVRRTATAEQVLQQGRKSLFSGDNEGSAKGQKISGLIEGIPWTLKE